jgi:putative ABC transport system permease protein
MLYGRFINEIDMREKRKVIVLGNNQVRELLNISSLSHSSQQAKLSAFIGQYIKVGNFVFRVVGIF